MHLYRIRDYVHIEPNCPALLFFSEIEKSFNVQELTRNLIEKGNSNMKIYKFPIEHGYANPYSPQYSEEYYDISLRLTKEFLKNNQR
jgi:hypothetical protein